MRSKTPTPCLHCGGGSAQHDAGGINANCHGYARGVNKHGGDVLTHPVVAVVCWGYYYRQNPDVAAEFGTLVSDLFESTYWLNLAEYGVGAGRVAGVATCNGDIFDGGAAGPAPQLQSWLSQGLVPHPQTAADARDWAYLIIPPPGEVVHNGDVTSLTGLCGYHGHHHFAFGLDFGDISHDPTWIGDFTGSGRSEVLFYSPTDGDWWLAQWDTDSRQLDWSLVSSTRAAFGNTSHDPTWIGDFTGSGSSEVLLDTPSDGQWWLAEWDAGSNQFDWGLVSSTRDHKGLNLGDTSHDPTWVGDFSGSGNSEVLLYRPHEGQWWLAQWNAGAGQFDWAVVSNTRDASGVDLGDTSHAPTWIGDFSGSGNSEVLLYTPPNGQWWLAQWDRLSAQFDWAVVSNTRDASGVDLGDTSHDPTWIGDFTGSGNSEVLLYTARDGYWWLAQWDAGSDQFDWRVVSRTRERRGVNLGDSSHDPTRIGDFSGSGKSEVLLYAPSNGQWWLAQWNGDAGQFDWKVVSRTRDPRGINLGDTSHDPTWVGDFIGVGKSEVLIYLPSNGQWWLARWNTDYRRLDWSLVSVTRSFKADVPFAIVAMPAEPSGSPHAVVDSVAYCISHELTETFTNPRGDGFWADANGCEVSDLCEQLGTLPMAGWNVEQYWSNKQKSCVL